VALAALLVAVALAASLVSAGTHYFYCEAMGVVAVDPCRAAVRDGLDGVAAVRAAHTDCCELVTLPPLPSAARGPDVGVAPALRVSLLLALPAMGLGAEGRAAFSRPRAWLERWPTAPPSPSAARARLMVFLT
jgi:hypothetical protein